MRTDSRTSGNHCPLAINAILLNQARDVNVFFVAPRSGRRAKGGNGKSFLTGRRLRSAGGLRLNGTRSVENKVLLDVIDFYYGDTRRRVFTLHDSGVVTGNQTLNEGRFEIVRGG